MVTCKYCDKEIIWEKQSNGKWKPLNTDRSSHDCLIKKKRKDWYLKKHAGEFRDQKILDSEFKRALDGGD